MANAKDVTIDTEFFKAMLVGTYGTGKSIFASTCPTPGFIFDFDEGIITYQGLDFDYEQYSADWKGWVKFEKDLIQVKKDIDDCKYNTVVVDSTSSMTDAAMARAMQLDPKRSATDGPIWNVHFMMVRNLMEGKLRQIIGLQCNVIIISHIDIVKDEKTGNILDIAPLLTGQLREKIPGSFQEVYYCTTKRVGQETEWRIQTVPIGYTKARSRLSGKAHLLPDFLPNNYNAIMQKLNAGKKK
ncbi:MAG: AAA family ATPase [Proteobacteria bacterium]|nr:AAA family ATPase [Pseudomonadota bacterium]